MKYAIVIAHAFGAQVFFFNSITDRDTYIERYAIPGSYALLDPTDWKEQA